jgi:hypothetical protein
MDALQPAEQETFEGKLRHGLLIREMDHQAPEGVLRSGSRSESGDALRKSGIVHGAAEGAREQVLDEMAAMGSAAGKTGEGSALEKGIELA